MMTLEERELVDSAVDTGMCPAAIAQLYTLNVLDICEYIDRLGTYADEQ